MINRGGPAFTVRIADQTGAPPATIAAAFFVTRNSYDMIALNGAIDALDTKVPGKLQLDLYAAIEDLLLDRVVWFVRNVNVSKSLAEVVEHYRAGIEAVASSLDRVLSEEGARSLTVRANSLINSGVPQELARRIASLPALAAAPDIVSVADRTGKDVPGCRGHVLCGGRILPARQDRERGARHQRHGLLRPPRARPCTRFDRRLRAATHRPRWSAPARPARRRSTRGSLRAPARWSASGPRCMASQARGSRCPSSRLRRACSATW
jgi:hypothetical protein